MQPLTPGHAPAIGTMAMSPTDVPEDVAEETTPSTEQDDEEHEHEPSLHDHGALAETDMGVEQDVFYVNSLATRLIAGTLGFST